MFTKKYQQQLFLMTNSIINAMKEIEKMDCSVKLKIKFINNVKCCIDNYFKDFIKELEQFKTDNYND